MSQEYEDNKVLLEVVKESQEEQRHQLHEIDEKATTVGQTVVAFSKVVIETNDLVRQQTEQLSTLVDNVKLVEENVSGVETQITEQTNVNNDLNKQLKQIETSVEQLKVFNEYSTTKLEEQLVETHQEVLQQLTTIKGDLTTVQELLKGYDPKTPIKVVEEQLIESRRQLQEASKDSTDNFVSLKRDLEATQMSLKSMVSELTETFNAVNTRQDIHEVSNRLLAIETRLNSLSEE